MKINALLTSEIAARDSLSGASYLDGVSVKIRGVNDDRAQVTLSACRVEWQPVTRDGEVQAH